MQKEENEKKATYLEVGSHRRYARQKLCFSASFILPHSALICISLCINVVCAFYHTVEICLLVLVTSELLGFVCI